MEINTLTHYKYTTNMLRDHCLVLSVCLSATLVYCGQTVGCIKMPLGSGDIVRRGNSFPHGNGHSSLPLFGPCLLWPNGRPSQQLSSCFILRIKDS